MSVEITGPKGYEFQYLMTVYVGLRASHFPNVQLIVEARDGEDAELRIHSDEGIKTVEVQVKSENSPLDLTSLTTWMAHFPDLKAEKNLLYRLDSDPMRFALFIARGRCADETQLFRTNNIDQHDKSPLLRDSVNNFLEILSNCYKNKSSELFINRNQFCQQQSNDFSRRKSILRKVCERMLIWEQMDEQSTKIEILKILHQEHSIPLGLCESVLMMLDEAVRNARNDRGDVMPEVLRILKEHSSQRIFNSFHTKRQEIDICYEELRTEHVLLLTGISFCGKTHAAEFIAEKFREEGFICSKVSNVNDASRILTDMSTENRLCILEDPFGGTELLKESPEMWGKLSSLTAKMGKHRKLIVTSRSDLLQMVTRENDIKSWKIQTYNWHDLTVSDSNLAIAIWEQYCEVKGISQDVKQKVIQGLNYSILQPGQLRHLAFIDPTELINKSRDELEQMAKADSNQLGQAFINKSIPELEILLIVLGMSTSSTKGLTQVQLFKLIEGIGLELETIFEQQLEYLEQHGYITYRNALWEFTHPTYFESAMFVIEHQGRFKRKHIVDIIIFAISSIESNLLLNIVRKFGRIHSKYTDSSFKQIIRDQAFLCLKHTSPAVRDAVLPFIISQMPELNYEEMQALINFIQRGNFESVNLEWQHGIPKIIEKTGYTLGDYTRYSLENFLTEEQCKNIFEKLAYPNPDNIVLPEEAWKVCQYLTVLPEKETNQRYLKQLMTYDEAMIRQKVAYFIMRHFSEDVELRDIVFQDGHPLVIKSAIHGCFQAWPFLSNETQIYLNEKINAVFQKTEICAATNNFMVKFSKDHTSDSIEWSEMEKSDQQIVWQLWATYFPIFLNTVPIMLLDVDQPYLFTTIQESAEFLDDNMKLSLAEAWFNWLDRYLRHSIPQDFGLGIADFLLTQISDTSLRRNLGVKLLNIEDSALVTVTLAEYIYNWGNLSVEEQQDVIEVMQCDRPDFNWLLAVAITRKDTPKVIVDLQPEISSILQQPVKAWSKCLPATLVADCLAVVTGYPFLLGSIGLANTDFSNWKKVLIQVFNEPHHLAFPIALNRVLQSVLNNYYNFNKEELELIETAWSGLCNHSDVSVRDACFQILLEKTVNINGSNSKRMWELFFGAEAVVENEEKYILQVLEFIESISRNCEWLDEVFGKEIEKKLLLHLPDDVSLLILLDKIESFPLRLQILHLEQALEQFKPRLFHTINIIRTRFNINRSVGGTLKLRELINQSIDRIFENRPKRVADPEIENWIYRYNLVD